MSGPDVRHAGWAIGGPGSRLRRRRNPVWLVLALVIGIVGAVAAAYGIAGLVSGTAPGSDEIVGEGMVAPLGGAPAAGARFTAPDGTAHTIWLRVDGMDSRARDTIVASVVCTVERPGRAPSQVRGSRQMNAAVVGDLATVGGFTAGGGENVVACRHEVFGQLRLRDRLRTAHPFVVAPGDPSAGILAFAFLFGGLAAIAGAGVLGVFWHRGRVRPHGSGETM